MAFRHAAATRRYVPRLTLAVALTLSGCNTGALEPTLGLDRGILADMGVEDMRPRYPAPPCSIIDMNSTVAPYGKDTAPIRLFLFTSYEGPYDQRIEMGALRSIREAYTGDRVQLLHFDLPLTVILPNAGIAAMAARAASEAGKFWEMNGLLFAKQAEWIYIKDRETLKAKFTEFAKSLGIDPTIFAVNLENISLQKAIEEDEKRAGSCMVQGVPAVFMRIPKGHIDPKELQDALTIVRVNNPGVSAYETPGHFVVLFPGAYPFEAFDILLSKVRF